MGSHGYSSRLCPDPCLVRDWIPSLGPHSASCHLSLHSTPGSSPGELTTLHTQSQEPPWGPWGHLRWKTLLSLLAPPTRVTISGFSLLALNPSTSHPHPQCPAVHCPFLPLCHILGPHILPSFMSLPLRVPPPGHPGFWSPLMATVQFQAVPSLQLPQLQNRSNLPQALSPSSHCPAVYLLPPRPSLWSPLCPTPSHVNPSHCPDTALPEVTGPPRGHRWAPHC